MGSLVLGGVISAGATILPLHAVTFHENDSSLDAVIASQTNNSAAPLTLVTVLSPTFVNPGYTFADWNTSEFGNGLQYLDGSVYDFSSGSVDLFAQWTENSVTFNENRSGVDTNAFVEPGNSLGTLTPFGSLSPSFSNPGYTFAGWTTSANGSGTSYANGASYDFRNGSLVLFAQWNLVPTETANFSPSGGTGSVSPMSGLQGSTITLPGSTGFSYPGYTFDGWNTSANGSGLAYSPGASFTLTADTTLYAQWAVNTVTFHENSWSGDATSAVQSSSVIATLSLVTTLSPTFSNPGYAFAGWTTNMDGTGTLYADGASYDFRNGSSTLYAKWNLIPTDQVTISGNGALGSVPIMTGLQGSPITLPAASAFTFTGHTFVSWNTLSTGSGISYLAGSTYVLSADLTLYAQWTPDVYNVTYVAEGGAVTPDATTYTVDSPGLTLPTPSYAGHNFTGWFTTASGGTLVGLGGAVFSPTASTSLYAQWQTVVVFTLTFDPNGGTGSVSPMSGPSGSTVTLPGVTGLSRPGYTLVNWATTATGTGATFASGSTTTLTASLTLYAQWTGHAPSIVLGAVGRFSGRSTSLTAVMRAQVSRFAAVIKSRHYKTVSLFGYASTGLVSLNRSISARRARSVAAYLRIRLSALHVKVAIKSAGEGSIFGAGAASNSRVEILAQ